MPRIFALMSTGVAAARDRVALVAFAVGQARLVKCLVRAFGMKRVRWA
jgi:hypothetical protein